MRLLKRNVHPETKEPRFVLEEHLGNNIPDYAILSHCWGPSNDEVSCADITTLSPALFQKPGYDKLRRSMDKAEEDGLSYLWVDTCCIDKSSSAELSEAINSMFAWYRDAAICYAFLEDVKSGFEDPKDQCSEFRESRWFTRGWTLQELIAPRSVTFFSGTWMELGTKRSLASTIFEITRIDKEVILQGDSEGISIAKRMSWAAGRETTRVEDRAYSLLGLFNVNMPTIYGEGAQAFQRLQNQILINSGDHSIFAYGQDPLTFGFTYEEDDYGTVLVDDFLPMFASSPDVFFNASNFKPMNHEAFWSKFGTPYAIRTYQMTNMGFCITLPVVSVDLQEVHARLIVDQDTRHDLFHHGGFNGADEGNFLAAIACSHDSYPAISTATCILLQRSKPRFDQSEPRYNHYERRSWEGRSTVVINTEGLNLNYWKCEQLYITEDMRSDHWNPWKRRYAWAPKRFALDFEPSKLFKIEEMTHPKGWGNNTLFNYSGPHMQISSTAVILRTLDNDEAFFAIFGFGNMQHDVWCHIEPCSSDSSVHTLYDAYHKAEKLRCEHPEDSTAAPSKDHRNNTDLIAISSLKTSGRRIIMKTRATPNESPNMQVVRIQAYDQKRVEAGGPPLGQNRLESP